MKRLIVAVLSILTLSFAGPTTYALTQEESLCQGAGGFYINGKCTNSPSNKGVKSVDTLFTRVSSILLFVVGAISVLMIIVGGIKYVVSGGDSAATKSAKNTILYALVGVGVAFLAYAAVKFVAEAFV